MKPRKVRVGVVGVGHLGQHHARIYAEMPEVELVGVADVNEARLKEVAERFKVPGFVDYRGLIGLAEAVSIAVPAILHYQIAREFLFQGVDVLVEKPIAETVEEAEDLVEIARTQGRLLQVGHIERFNGAVRALEGLIVEPGFIECHRLSPFPGRAMDVDVVLDLMIHDIDVILSLVKSKVKEVSAVGVPVISDQVDIANARIQFESGCVANVTASRVSVERMRKIRIFQRDTYLSLDYATQEIALYRRILPDAPDGLPRIVREEVSIDKAEPLRVELQSFVDCVRTRRRPLVSGEEGRDALKVALQILHTLQKP